MSKSITPIKPIEMMDGNFQDFIGVWENHVPKFVCDKLITIIDNVLENFSRSPLVDSDISTSVMEGDTQFHNTNIGRKDYAVMLQHIDKQVSFEFDQYLHACFLDYNREYGQLHQTPLISTDQKLQKTEPGGGYHVWHCENSGYQFAQRVLVWSIYLNDMPDGEAETEFLYQKRRIKPKRGTCVIWPAAYTHIHRGNPVYTQNKYLLTGWYCNMVTI